METCIIVTLGWIVMSIPISIMTGRMLARSAELGELEAYYISLLRGPNRDQ